MVSDCFLSVNSFYIAGVGWGGGVQRKGKSQKASIANFYSETVVFQFHVTVVVHFLVCISVDLFAACA